ncbi:unnamed protein product [Symbiodinium natans]|uniref:Treble clef zinc finger domain-containing protein n=1 Tax=Symbiodinium natans TaxID=878477 RepID=A0A812I5W4_9DINO|nr:unnamed protein product [Symbiodinium natans]
MLASFRVARTVGDRLSHNGPLPHGLPGLRCFQRVQIACACSTCKTPSCRPEEAAKRFSTRTPEQKAAALLRLKDFAATKNGHCLSENYVNLLVKLTWQCEHGHVWQASPGSVLHAKSWCPRCAADRCSITLKRLQDHAQARSGKCLSTECKNSRSWVRWQCEKGHVWESTAKQVLYRNSWCPECSQSSRKRRKLSLQDLRTHAASCGGQCLAPEYTGMMTRVPWQCQHGHSWHATPNSVLNSHSWCPVCAGVVPIGLERLRKHAAKKGGVCLATEYANNWTKVTWKCRFGHTWQSMPRNVLNRNNWCPHCQKICPSRLQTHAASFGGQCLAKSYSSSHNKVLWECREGHQWKARATNVLHQKTWCPQCAVSYWRTESEIRSILEFIFHPFQFVSSYPSFLEGLQLDGYCPELRLAFEYQGQQHYDPNNYFHFGDPSSFRAQQERDSRKERLCRENGVRLVLVPFFAKDKRTFVVSALLQWFAISEVTPVALVA